MKFYSFGQETAPVIFLLPGTCCHWQANFGGVIPLLVACHVPEQAGPSDARLGGLALRDAAQERTP